MISFIEGMNSVIAKRPNHKQRNEYVNFHMKTSKNELPERGGSFSRRSSNIIASRGDIGALRTISQPSQDVKQEVYEYTYDGKKKRKRFNEDLTNETISILSKQS
jgi:hypothetical protein